MITDFPAKSILNVGGYAEFEFAPYYLVDSISSASSKVISEAVTFLIGYGFYQGYATQESLMFKESNEINDQGKYYKPSIKGFIPGDTAELAQLMEDMEAVTHLVKITDYQGKHRLVGIEAPLEFTADFNSGDQPGSEKGYAFEFFGEALYRAPFYEVESESE